MERMRRIKKSLFLLFIMMSALFFCPLSAEASDYDFYLYLYLIDGNTGETIAPKGIWTAKWKVDGEDAPYVETDKNYETGYKYISLHTFPGSEIKDWKKGTTITVTDIQIPEGYKLEKDSYSYTITESDIEYMSKEDTSRTIYAYVNKTDEGKKITNANIEWNLSDIVYQDTEGTEMRPKVEIIRNGETLTSSDYNITYENNTAPGEATVTITGKGNYSNEATVSKKFKIVGRATKDQAKVTFDQTSFVFDSKEHFPNVQSVIFMGKTLGSKDYAVCYYVDQGSTWYDYKYYPINNYVKGRINAGNYKVYIVIKSDFYRGILDYDFTITASNTNSSSTEGNNTVNNDTNTGNDSSTSPESGTTIKDTTTGESYTVKTPSNNNGTIGTIEYTKPKDYNVTYVTIPETITVDGTTYKVTSIADNAFKNNKSLIYVKIGKNVTTIGKNAFYNCKKLKTITMGSNVTTIGNKAFYNCSAVKKVTIPSKVKKIGKQAFYNCKNLKSITIKTTKLTTKNVGSKAFGKINSKATLKVPSKKLKAYKTLLKKKGVTGKKQSIKKYK